MMRLFHSVALGKFCSSGLYKGVWGEPGRSLSVPFSYLAGYTLASGHLPPASMSPPTITTLPMPSECSPLPLNCWGFLQEGFLSHSEVG